MRSQRETDKRRILGFLKKRERRFWLEFFKRGRRLHQKIQFRKRERLALMVGG